ncbi:MAG: class I SAM-dependent methyltransferase [Candidatus Omnitrophota bacterium]
MTINCVVFASININSAEITRKRVLEIGSYNVNGSIRPLIERYNPAEYLGVDIENGPGVDIKCDIQDLLPRFGENSFDFVVSTEMLEHIRDWRQAIHIIKSLCRPGGVILITTRSIGFPYHGYPHDYWRFEYDDLKVIFKDLKIASIEKDSPEAGIFIKCIKPDDFKEADFSGYEVYSILSDKRVRELSDKLLFRLRIRLLTLRDDLRYYLRKAIDKILFIK